MRNATVVALLGSLIVFLPATVQAQTASSGTVLGTVTDPTGAVIAGAKLELRNTATDEVRTQTTNASGGYLFANVAPGSYRVSASAEGFHRAVVNDLKVEVAKSVTHDFKLEIGAVAQTVEVTAAGIAPLQTTDAQIGQSVSGDELQRLPTLRRNAAELLNLQPGVSVGTGGFPRVGVRVAGAIDDQNTFSLDGIDVTDNIVGGGATLGTMVPLSVASVEEYRLGVSNPNASFGRASGGQVSVVSRAGTNSFHGNAYWVHQNDELNANSWENNRAGIKRAELKDNRFGGSLGGPVWKNKTFFFANYEGRRFPQIFNILRLVPSNDLRNGILNFRDSSGVVRQYNLATVANCGAGGNSSCDPRGLGISPSVKALWALMPAGNDPSAPGGDGLNTLGFRATVGAPLSENYYVARMDHEISSQWRFNGSYRYFKHQEIGGFTTPTSGQVDIRGGTARAVSATPFFSSSVIAGLVGQFAPNLINSFHFGYVRHRADFLRLAPSASAALLNIPGTGTSAGAIALAPVSAVSTSVDVPIDVDTQRARFQASIDKNFQFTDDLNWIKGDHSMQFGLNIRRIPTIHFRNDKVVGSLASLVALMDAGLGVSFLQIPAANRPLQCGAGVTTFCLSAGDINLWDRLYAGTLGMVDNVSILIARDGSLNPLPFGTPLLNDTILHAFEFYGQDTWRLKPTLTLTYGLSYGWQQAPTETLGRQTLMIDNGTGKVLTARDYLNAKADAARNGQTFNPEIGFLPVKSAKRDVFNIDRGNVAPRVSLAWNPSYSGGWLGRWVGERKTVVRGGFSLVYDRTNTVQSVIIPMLGVGFGQTINVQKPLCNASNAPGSGCNASAADAGSSVYRVGVDGPIPLPTVPPAKTPVVPSPVFSELLSFQVDPDTHVGRSYSFDLSVQRELPWNMLLEVGWTGRWSRNLPLAVNFNTSPYFFKDSASGQTFAQAFDAMAVALRNNQSPATQAWFENQLQGYSCAAATTATGCMASNFRTSFTDGAVSTLFTNMNLIRRRLGLPSFNNLQALEMFMRTYIGRSNYQGLFVALRKRMSHGLATDFNYTFSKALDYNIANQNSAGLYSNSFDPTVEYGPSIFDRTHVLNGRAVYDLPLGKGHRLSTGKWFDRVLGGWYLSGILTLYSGLPLTVTQSGQVWGGGQVFAAASAAIPTVSPGSFGNEVHSGVAGSNGIGTAGDPAKKGTGLNLFSNPDAAFNSFRKVLISQDGRTGRGNPLRGLPFKNLDLAIGKKTSITERASISYSLEFFNVFNHVVFADPGPALTARETFGVLSQQFIPANRAAGSRWIQVGVRIDF